VKSWLACHMQVDGVLLFIAVGTLSGQQSQLHGCSCGRQPVVRVASGVCVGKPQLGCSVSGRCVSVVWPHAREYLVFIAGEAGTWTKLTEGVGTHLVSCK
jgi:hypothetical protein